MPQIPDKLYFRIGEVARLCDVPAYVLRFWEGEFPQLKPNKGGTGQRLYRRRDVEMALRIKGLLYDEGYTIPGARQAFKGDLHSSKGSNSPTGPQDAADSRLGHDRVADGVALKHLVALRTDLQDLLQLLSRPAIPRASIQSIRNQRGLAAVPERPATSAPRIFPKPRLLQPKPTPGYLESLFDFLPPEG